MTSLEIWVWARETSAVDPRKPLADSLPDRDLNSGGRGCFCGHGGGPGGPGESSRDMRITVLVLLCAVALGGGRRHGRRLFQNIERKPRPAAAVAAPRKEPVPEAEPARLTANRTIDLLRERELLQDRVAAIDHALAADRDQKRRDLTAQYEREMRELEEDWGAGAAPARASPSPELNGALRQQVSAALASYRQPPRGSELPHQDVEHQVDEASL